MGGSVRECRSLAPPQRLLFSRAGGLGLGCFPRLPRGPEVPSDLLLSPALLPFFKLLMLWPRGSQAHSQMWPHTTEVPIPGPEPCFLRISRSVLGQTHDDSQKMVLLVETWPSNLSWLGGGGGPKHPCSSACAVCSQPLALPAWLCCCRLLDHDHIPWPQKVTGGTQKEQ